MQHRAIPLTLSLALVIVGCQDLPVEPLDRDTALSAMSFAEPATMAARGGFAQGVIIPVDGEDFYLMGPPVYEGADARDVPGHYWVLAGKDRLAGKHYNTGPFGAPQWWSSDAPDGELLYIVDAVIDDWTPAKAARYADRGFVHYHELVSADSGELHPTKVVWLRHKARTTFTLDGGPHPEAVGHRVTPGIDFEFMPNWAMPYPGP